MRKIVVPRPDAVGDFVFALPALHALKQAYPGAELDVGLDAVETLACAALVTERERMGLHTS